MPISARALRSNGSTDFGKVSFFVIGKVFSDFAELSERDGAEQGAAPSEREGPHPRALDFLRPSIRPRPLNSPSRPARRCAGAPRRRRRRARGSNNRARAPRRRGCPPRPGASGSPDHRCRRAPSGRAHRPRRRRAPGMRGRPPRRRRRARPAPARKTSRPARSARQIFSADLGEPARRGAALAGGAIRAQCRGELDESVLVAGGLCGRRDHGRRGRGTGRAGSVATTKTGFSTAGRRLRTPGSTRGQKAKPRPPASTPATSPAPAFTIIDKRTLRSWSCSAPLHQALIELVRVGRAGAAVRRGDGMGHLAERVPTRRRSRPDRWRSIPARPATAASWPTPRD